MKDKCKNTFIRSNLLVAVEEALALSTVEDEAAGALPQKFVVGTKAKAPLMLNATIGADLVSILNTH